MSEKGQTLPSDVARALRAIPSEKRAQASRENGKKGGGPLKPLMDVKCTCKGSGLDHRSYCPRGKVIRYRQARGLPLT